MAYIRKSEGGKLSRHLLVRILFHVSILVVFRLLVRLKPKF